MVATIVLSILIFGAAGFVIYRQVKKGSSCENCHTDCAVKKVVPEHILEKNK